MPPLSPRLDSWDTTYRECLLNVTGVSLKWTRQLRPFRISCVHAPLSDSFPETNPQASPFTLHALGLRHDIYTDHAFSRKISLVKLTYFITPNDFFNGPFST